MRVCVPALPDVPHESGAELSVMATMSTRSTRLVRGSTRSCVRSRASLGFEGRPRQRQAISSHEPLVQPIRSSSDATLPADPTSSTDCMFAAGPLYIHIRAHSRSSATGSTRLFAHVAAGRCPRNRVPRFLGSRQRNEAIDLHVWLTVPPRARRRRHGGARSGSSGTSRRGRWRIRGGVLSRIRITAASFRLSYAAQCEHAQAPPMPETPACSWPANPMLS